MPPSAVDDDEEETVCLLSSADGGCAKEANVNETNQEKQDTDQVKPSEMCLVEILFLYETSICPPKSPEVDKTRYS